MRPPALAPQLKRDPLGGRSNNGGTRALPNAPFGRKPRMAKTYTCRDVGVDCDWKVSGKDEADVMNKIKEHARTVHKMDPIPADLERKVRAAIRDQR